MPKAEKEIETLLDSQWTNGFIPHIIFHTESDTYFPGADFHRSDLHPQSSKKYNSTGMTQPPVTGFVLEEIYKISKNMSYRKEQHYSLDYTKEASKELGIYPRGLYRPLNYGVELIVKALHLLFGACRPI